MHHINMLVDSGLVIHQGSRYLLRVDNLSELIKEVEKDLLRTLQDIEEVARSIDTRLN